MALSAFATALLYGAGIEVGMDVFGAAGEMFSKDEALQKMMEVAERAQAGNVTAADRLQKAEVLAQQQNPGRVARSRVKTQIAAGTPEVQAGFSNLAAGMTESMGMGLPLSPQAMLYESAKIGGQVNPEILAANLQAMQAGGEVMPPPPDPALLMEEFNG